MNSSNTASYLFNISTNATTLPPLQYVFGMPQILDISVATVSLFLNGLCCFLILTDRSLLHNAFYLYVLNLSLCICTSFVVNTPLYLFRSGYNRFWLGESACGFVLYGVYVIGPWAIFCHVLITANRFWAIVFPVAYRERHTPFLAVMLCVGAFLVTNVVMVPLVVIRLVYGPELKYYRYQCTISTPGNKIVLIAVSVCATIILALELLIVVSYPLLLYKYRKQRRTNPAISHNNSTQKNSGVRGRSQICNAGSAGVAGHHTDRPYSSGPFLMLTFFTVSYVLLMVPSAFYLSVGSIFRFFSEKLFAILYILTVLQSVVDPLIFLITLHGLRKALKKLLSRHCRS